MNVNLIIDGILDRVKEGTPPYLSKGDAGGRTSWGISERAHPEAWLSGPPTREIARAIYLAVYVTPFFALQGIASDALITALVDDAVMSGVDAAIKRLQWVLGIHGDGVIGKDTLAAVRIVRPNKLLQRYVIERVVRITRLVERRPTDLTNLTGWVARILGFLPEAVN